MIVFRCYDPSADRAGGIHEWYNGIAPAFQAQVDAALEILGLEDNLKDVPEVKALRGACEGLSEIIIDFKMGEQQVHIRILGRDGPGSHEFTLLTGFEKTNNNAIYGHNCRAAHERWEGVTRDGRRAPFCNFP